MVKSNTIQDFLSHLGISFPGASLMRKYANEKPPLRSELYSSDQMEQHGKILAASHTLSTGYVPDHLLKRLADNEEVLLEVHNLLTETVKANHRITSAGEWLLDNFYLIEDQIRTGKRHLPKGYSQGLPRLSDGSSKNLPRVYDIALEIISHSDGRVDPNGLESFIQAYQTITPLKLGELWAIPIMLRLALIENLRRVAARIAIGRINRNLADYWATEMKTIAEKDPKSLILVIADMARSEPPMESSFVAELTRKLQGKGPELALPLTWMEQRLSEMGLTSIELVHLEAQKQAADQVSMSNSIGSLRFLATMDWREFVETTSIVEQTLSEDIGGVYSKMDFSTRDHYRHVVEKIAKNSTVSEHAVARIAIDLAREGAEKNAVTDRTAHVGYYLVDKGLPRTQKLSQMRFSAIQVFRKVMGRSPLLLYAGSITLISLIIAGGLLAKAYADKTGRGLLIVVGILSVLCASYLAVALVNWIATLLLKPLLLPRMDFSKGIYPECRTMVVVPTLLSGIPETEGLVEALEVRFLANRDEHLHFGLLTDFADADKENMPEDEILLQHAQIKIEELNKKYERDANDIFFLFHRPRRWNPRDRIWMGYERKRGKLTDLNALLRHGTRDAFSLIVGDPDIYTKIKYVITLDTDTQLPRDSAWKLAGTMAHPLNHPLYNEKKQRVTEGYGILQPQVAISLTGSGRSLHAKMHSNDSGIDPYTRAISDVYQDLFGEGSFIGKGIYEVETFERVLNGRFPENRILSHDLLEGCYTRSGFLSDVQLYEEYPALYSADASRRQRWIRGDWQVGAWCLPFVPGVDNRFKKNPLPALSRWKIFDNLRRSLVPPALTILLVLGWTVLPSAWFWTLLVTGIVILPSIITALWSLFRKPDDVLMEQHVIATIYSAYLNFTQAIFSFICLPYEAWYSVDAILRTNWRMAITKKRLLQWNPSLNVEKNGRKNIFESYVSMWFGPFISMATFMYLLVYSPITIVIAFPILILWTMAPGIVWLISLPISQPETKLTVRQHAFLHKLSRKTWAFFENFVGPEDNWLPPDNYQEHPVAIIAHRTSPTNIGLSLLANLSAYDFGYIGIKQFIERTASSISTMEIMETYQGHFYNWYDTITLKPLPPKYISSVDSGNLAGHLLTLRQGLLTMPHQKIQVKRFFEGLRTTAKIVEDTMGETVSNDLRQFNIHINAACLNHPVTLNETKACLENLVSVSQAVLNNLKTNAETESLWWAKTLATQTRRALDDLLLFVPWLSLAPVPEKFAGIAGLTELPTIYELSIKETNVPAEIQALQSAENTKEENEWLAALRETVIKAARHAKEQLLLIERLAAKSFELANMEYDFLYDKSKKLLAIGYNVEEHRRDQSFYDLLASEARLGSFVAIAQGKLPQENWFALGRLLTNAGGDPILLSWSGSMFEYLMPLIIMPTYENTLLDQTNKATVERQIEYGKQRDVPWGVSESGYNMVDAAFNYQYRAFGVPGLGLKRGLGEDLVIAPYASVMALMVSPEEACKNMEQLADDGFEGKFGFYEAIDYTTSRLPRGQAFAIVRSFMVHHQGMSLLSLAYLLLDRPMQQRFASEPLFQATLLLLQERIPKATSFYSHTTDIADISSAPVESEIRLITTPHTPVPEVQLLSNGRYHVMVTNAGGGYSRWKDIAVTRWREDSTCDNWGTFCYIRDEDNDEYWSTAHQPALKPAKNYEVIFSQGHAEFRIRDKDFETKTEIVVSPEDDIEMRRVRITNRSRTQRSIEVTSYSEVVLASAAADVIHPAFSNLFVQTEIISRYNAILCTRRPRSVGEQSPWMFHLMKVHGVPVEDVSYETDRMQFIGRGNTIANPKAMTDFAPLSNNQGSVLDPIVAIRYRIKLEPEQTATIDMVSGIGETTEICHSLIEKYQDRNLADRAIELAWAHSQVVLRQINAREADAQLYERLASSVIYVNPLLRADASVIIRNHRGQSGLWSYSISGDLPIVLLRIEDQANIVLVKQLIQAHAYWRLKGLVVDLVIWNEDQAGYRQVLQDQITGLIAAGIGANMTDRPGGIFIRSADQISEEDRILFQTVARIIIADSRGTLVDQVNRRRAIKTQIPALIPTQARSFGPSPVTELPGEKLQFFNGLGGFTGDGNEYKITITNPGVTPAPWVNVIANPGFGTVISESGQSYTWTENAHEMRLTPWNNDPVSDTGGETFYIRDEESGYYWSPTPLPVKGKTPYITRHGFGYSIFEHTEDGIHSELWVYVDLAATVKFAVLKVQNQSGKSRRLSATGYAEWVLGDLKHKSAMHIVTEVDPGSGALFAKNPYNSSFAGNVAFFDVDDLTRSFTGDRTEFIGRNGNLGNPEAMKRIRLSGKVGAALDSCAAIQVAFDMIDGQEREIIFRIGTAKNLLEAGNMVHQFRGIAAAYNALDKVKKYWQQNLGILKVETPDTALNILANGWLQYQVIACRLWARSGFYQSGGAFGFRDQLQDVLSLLQTQPFIAREQILLSASRQFKEGDVQHWWHPPTGRGVRTRCSDDFLWLPFVTGRYVVSTGDTGILDEPVYYLEGRMLNPGEESYYDLPGRSALTDSLYQHCKRAIEHGLSFGDHGLPLMGSGDWNDGMDMVGKHGKGESVWLGFFLYMVLIRFKEIAILHNDNSFADLCQQEAGKLQKNIEKNAWDGEWYRRAYFDDGRALGSAVNEECQIDSIAQSWSVLSGAGNTQRTHTAMEAADKRLVRRDIGLIQLLDPPFDKSDLNPGYIKGYVPGVRENGGQYTHAAIWMIMAFAALGDSKRAWELFSMINPVNHGNSAAAVASYKVEPYVVAADIYASPQHKGRGGWTWYTGSAGWMYQLIIESLLGLKLETDKLYFTPCLPAGWQSFKINYYYRNTLYTITVVQISGANEVIHISLDDVDQNDNVLVLVDDRTEHIVEVKVTVATADKVTPFSRVGS
jgi:cyclic beta-1,2-glucan synthetase